MLAKAENSSASPVRQAPQSQPATVGSRGDDSGDVETGQMTSAESAVYFQRLSALAQQHKSGALTDAQFSAASARLAAESKSA